MYHFQTSFTRPRPTPPATPAPTVLQGRPMNFPRIQISVTPIEIQFPALDNLVNYMRENRNTQEAIDGLTAQVRQLTQGLNQSTTNLEKTIKEK
jgi:hypothetical protein